MVEIKIKQDIEKEEGFAPLPKDTCLNCHKKMIKVKEGFKCIKCGIMIEDN